MVGEDDGITYTLGETKLREGTAKILVMDQVYVWIRCWAKEKTPLSYNYTIQESKGKLHLLDVFDIESW